MIDAKLELEDSQKHQDYTRMIWDGISFLKGIAEVYGAERSIEVWDKLGEAMGDEVKQQVFLTMLKGDITRVYLRQGTMFDGGNAVAAIKAIRGGTGLGLKEAKDTWDYVASGQSIRVECLNVEAMKQMTQELGYLNIAVTA